MSQAAALRALESDDAFILLATVTSPALAAPIRVARNETDIVSGGETFKAAGFDFQYPEESEESEWAAEIIVDNIDPELVEALRTSSARPLITIGTILASDPDSVENLLPDMELVSASYDSTSVTGKLATLDFATEPAVFMRFVPQWFPGLQ